MSADVDDADEPEELPEEIVHWQPNHRPPLAQAHGAVAHGATATGSSIMGALALGALAIGALAIGALAIGRLNVRHARFGRLEIDELVVRRLSLPKRG
jgi:hypothetical protein